MNYRNGTYIAFHGNDTTNPTESDRNCYEIVKMWKIRDDDFTFVNSHEKTNAVRDSSKKETLRRALIARMNKSKHLLLIVGETTKNDDDWIPFEIEYAAEECGIPIIVAYTDTYRVVDPSSLWPLWPDKLMEVITKKTVGVIHVPFRKDPIADAISQFGVDKHPKSTLSHYSSEAYDKWGL